VGGNILNIYGDLRVLMNKALRGQSSYHSTRYKNQKIIICRNLYLVHILEML